MTKTIDEFVDRFNAKISLNEKMIVKKQRRYFLLNENLKQLATKEFFYAGIYLGKTRNGKFFPSFSLLKIITENQNANKVIVDEKTEWLFICGRDIFKLGIMKVIGSKRKGNHTLILNQYGECLGFGKMQVNLDEQKEGVAIKNISDIGDFLRREKHL